MPAVDRPGCVAARKWAGPTHLESGQMIHRIDQIKCSQPDAAQSELLPSTTPPLGSDLHYQDK